MRYAWVRHEFAKPQRRANSAQTHQMTMTEFALDCTRRSTAVRHMVFYRDASAGHPVHSFSAPREEFDPAVPGSTAAVMLAEACSAP